MKIIKIALIFILLATPLYADDKYYPKNRTSQLTGTVQSGNTPIAFSRVTLYRAGIRRDASAVVLGKSKSDRDGIFEISYRPPRSRKAVLYLIADGGFTKAIQRDDEWPGSDYRSDDRERLQNDEWSRDFEWHRYAKRRPGPVRLATVLGGKPFPADVVINERTTVATAYTMAQFISGRNIAGNAVGLKSAALIFSALVDLETGEIGQVLGNPPNGPVETTTMREFNSLANMLASCVNESEKNACASLFFLAKPPRSRFPRNTLQAAVNIAHNPGSRVQGLFFQSRILRLYEPDLGLEQIPDAWTLAIRYNGESRLFDGPGNIAFDRHGNAWVNNNYKRSILPENVCGDDRLFKLAADGSEAPGSPFGGDVNNGGLYGAGFGITVDPHGDVWVGNFGFQGSECSIGSEEQALLSQSVSQFNSDGEALSPDTDLGAIPPVFGGWRSPQANIGQPQSTVSNRHGDIWLANCGNDSVTKLIGGDPDNAENFIPVNPAGKLLAKPFGIAFDIEGNAWIASNANDSVIALAPDGTLIGEPIVGDPINLPMGIATDSLGNVWIANSGAARPPCGGDQDKDRLSPDDANAEIPPEGASVTRRRPDGELEIFTGGGIFIPWGIAVDGDDNVWVANFGGPRSGLVGVSQICGARESTCPPGFKTGDPISPDTGYTSDGLVRNTGVAIDPAGNVWLTNNWLIDAFDNLENPGGHEVVVFIGLAGPVKTPLNGPPRQPH